MKNRNGIIAICVIGIIMLSFTLAVFFLREVERTPLNLWALTFLLISEVVFCAGLISLWASEQRAGAVFRKAGVTTALSLYFLCTFISVLFSRSFGDKLNSFILLQLAFISVFAIITIAVLAYSNAIGRRDAEDFEKVGTNGPKRGGF